MEPVTWDLVRRRAYLWTLTLTVLVALPAAWLAGRAQAWSVVAGALLGLLNLLALARAIERLVREVQAAPQLRAASRSGATLALVRWPVAALATVAVLWYMPGRPEGLAAGVFTALVAFCLAALEAREGLSRDDSEPDA
ncbi:MAG TPA: ATP synthase subunit I [Nannocystis sp.]